ncbi:MAG: hypothetical protein JWO67_4501 [Streptosporangiaceae bacterium]|nr:hypothetical protein [Streptosporangiaceae bacterium]
MVKRRRAMSPEEKAGKKGAHERSGLVCERCGRAHATEVHHRKNRSQGGTWALSNLMDLCSPCHLEVTAFKTIALEQGWSVLREQDPAHEPVWLAGRGYCFLADTGEIHEPEDQDDAA